MGFEIFGRKVQWRGSPAVSFTKLGRIMFNKAVTAKFEKEAVDNVLLMWDSEKRLIGVRSISKKDNRAYKLRYGRKNNSSGFSATTFMKYININYTTTFTLPAIFDDQGMILTVKVPEEHLRKSDELIKPVSIEEGKKAR